jgi:hypothetical protein
MGWDPAVGVGADYGRTAEELEFKSVEGGGGGKIFLLSMLPIPVLGANEYRGLFPRR